VLLKLLDTRQEQIHVSLPEVLCSDAWHQIEIYPRPQCLANSNDQAVLLRVSENFQEGAKAF
jgi:hypothetical protein